MTLLAFAFAEDRSHVLIAADRAATFTEKDPPPDYGFTASDLVRVHKLHQVKDRPLVWAMVGSGADLKPFGEWIDSATPETWEELAQEAGTVASALDEKAQKRGHAAKIKKTEIQRSSYLIVGFCDRLTVVQIECTGAHFFFDSWGMKSGFIGPYGGTARAAWQAVVACDAAQRLGDLPTMHTFFDSLCDTIPGLLGPVDVWKITDAGTIEMENSSP